MCMFLLSQMLKSYSSDFSCGFNDSYLPPPVLAMLNNKQLEAGKRAAMISTSLKWLLDHIPEKVVPIQLRAALTVLKALVPFVGYLAAFIAWSWATIKMFDKGLYFFPVCANVSVDPDLVVF